MSENEITVLENKIHLIEQYESLAKDATEKAEAVKSEIKNLMTEMGVDTLKTHNFIVRFVQIVSNRFDTARFKQDFGKSAYTEYCREVVSMKFTISK